jgi:acyl-CoA synthetase (AMP-forming)/AMP-acid ligase II
VSERPVLCWPDGQLTRRELAVRIGRTAARIGRRQGVVAVRARNDPETVVIVLAALACGRPAALLWPAWTAYEDAAARALLGQAEQVDADGQTVWATGPGARVIHDDRTALIAFTSGSTGRPRAVELSREHLDRVSRNTLEASELAAASEQSVFAPLSHVLALCCQLLPGLSAGLTTHLLTGLIPARRLLESGNAAGALAGVPAHWEALLRHGRFAPGSVASVSHVLSAGAPLPPSLRQRLSERFPAAMLYNAYGLTEAPRVAILSSRDRRFPGNATGRAVPDMELRVVADGELQLRGPAVMLGYLGAPEATAARLDDGWLRTGDAALLDHDVVTVLGRLDDLRNVGGELISMTEIDQELCALHGVRDAATIVTADGGFGTEVVAFLVGGHELRRRRPSELREVLAGRLSWAKVPRRFYLLEELPRTPNGKLRRRLLLSFQMTATELTD